MLFEIIVHFCEDDFENWKVKKEKDDASIDDFVESTYDEIYPILKELPSDYVNVDFEERLW